MPLSERSLENGRGEDFGFDLDRFVKKASNDPASGHLDVELELVQALQAQEPVVASFDRDTRIMTAAFSGTAESVPTAREIADEIKTIEIKLKDPDERVLWETQGNSYKSVGGRSTQLVHVECFKDSVTGWMSFEQLKKELAPIIAKLPPDTKIYANEVNDGRNINFKWSVLTAASRENLHEPPESEMEHEYMRIRTLDHDQLITRLYRITDPQKMFSFAKALRKAKYSDIEELAYDRLESMGYNNEGIYGGQKRAAGVEFNDKEQKWYGGSHRAKFGFGVGDKVKEGDVLAGVYPVGHEIKTLDQAKEAAEHFAELVSSKKLADGPHPTDVENYWVKCPKCGYRTGVADAEEYDQDPETGGPLCPKCGVVMPPEDIEYARQFGYSASKKVRSNDLKEMFSEDPKKEDQEDKKPETPKKPEEVSEDFFLGGGNTLDIGAGMASSKKAARNEDLDINIKSDRIQMVHDIISNFKKITGYDISEVMVKSAEEQEKEEGAFVGSMVEKTGPLIKKYVENTYGDWNDELLYDLDDELIKKVSSKRMAATYQVWSDYKKKNINVPPRVAKELDQASTPEEIEKVISDNESLLASVCVGPEEEFLYCDHAADLMSNVLTKKGIAHEVVTGRSDEGSAHLYIKIGDKRYDPTHQGFGDKFKEEKASVKLAVDVSDSIRRKDNPDRPGTITTVDPASGKAKVRWDDTGVEEDVDVTALEVVAADTLQKPLGQVSSDALGQQALGLPIKKKTDEEYEKRIEMEQRQLEKRFEPSELSFAEMASAVKADLGRWMEQDLDRYFEEKRKEEEEFKREKEYLVDSLTELKLSEDDAELLAETYYTEPFDDRYRIVEIIRDWLKKGFTAEQIQRWKEKFDISVVDDAEMYMDNYDLNKDGDRVEVEGQLPGQKPTPETAKSLPEGEITRTETGTSSPAAPVRVIENVYRTERAHKAYKGKSCLGKGQILWDG